MNQDALVIARSILELKQDGDVLKDYIFPFFVAFFSALLGAGVAYSFNKRQERHRIERERFDLANKLLSDVTSALNSLVSIKSNYIGLTEVDPYKRAFSIPFTMLDERSLGVDIARYYFIEPKQTCNFTIMQKISRWINQKIVRVVPSEPSMEDFGKSWRNLMRVKAFVNNYNYILFVLHKRNAIEEDIKKEIQTICRQQKVDPRKASLEFVLLHLEGEKLVHHVHLTELFISLLDHVLKEMDSFVNCFPDIAESNIEMKMIGERAKVVRVINDRPAYLASLIPIIKPDFRALSKIVGRNLRETEQTYTFRDWY
ncbi:hypothetical protein [Enterobacter chengduensis]|uniref:hypothetical protein n=1 Tax=Enterobacter chengduensis TaxID=2494701 RepID=UPI0020039652|nr:hypothetical protein [Enterobacter chengduensis]MCK7450345.1 hypothetical protein [Enterobacter chengduensis]